jgi:nucleotide-binding universal stress UspA family protein
MKLLFPVDGSDAALAALDKLGDIIHWFSETPQIILINVHASLPYPRAAAWAGHEAVEQFHDEESEKALAEPRKRLERSGRSFTVEKRVGDPAEEIVRFAEAEGCELIAMGTHGRSALKNLVMGSVATKVLAVSKAPVLLLK